MAVIISGLPIISVDKSWVAIGLKNVTLFDSDSFFFASSSISADESAREYKEHLGAEGL
jgi:hypothetical protein